MDVSQVPTQPSPAPPAQQSWTDAFPQPRSTPPGISVEELAQIVKTKQAGKDYIVVDVRRTDFESFAITRAINLPAHSFHPTLPGILSLFSHIPLVVFHCQSCGKPGSRGRRVAAWYQDALDEQGIKTSEARYLEGGVKAWVEKFGEDGEWVVKLPVLE